jgi:hypothetical protein
VRLVTAWQIRSPARCPSSPERGHEPPRHPQRPEPPYLSELPADQHSAVLGEPARRHFLVWPEYGCPRLRDGRLLGGIGALDRGSYTLAFGGESVGAHWRWWMCSAFRNRVRCCSPFAPWLRSPPSGVGGPARRVPDRAPPALATQAGPHPTWQVARQPPAPAASPLARHRAGACPRLPAAWRLACRCRRRRSAPPPARGPVQSHNRHAVGAVPVQALRARVFRSLK